MKRRKAVQLTRILLLTPCSRVSLPLYVTRRARIELTKSVRLVLELGTGRGSAAADARAEQPSVAVAIRRITTLPSTDRHRGERLRTERRGGRELIRDSRPPRVHRIVRRVNEIAGRVPALSQVEINLDGTAGSRGKRDMRASARFFIRAITDTRYFLYPLGRYIPTSCLVTTRRSTIVN